MNLSMYDKFRSPPWYIIPIVLGGIHIHNHAFVDSITPLFSVFDMNRNLLRRVWTDDCTKVRLS